MKRDDRTCKRVKLISTSSKRRKDTIALIQYDNIEFSNSTEATNPAVSLKKNKNPSQRDSALWLCSQSGSLIKTTDHSLLFHTVALFTRSLRCMLEVNENSLHLVSSFSLPPSHLILSGTRCVWFPSLWQLPAYCARLAVPWSLRSAMAPWVSTETPLAIRLQDQRENNVRQRYGDILKVSADIAVVHGDSGRRERKEMSHRRLNVHIEI